MKKEYQLYPHIGFNEITFGMERNNVHLIMGPPIRSIKNRTNEGLDVYDGVTLIYTVRDFLAEATFTPRVNVEYQRMELLSDYSSLKKLIENDSPLECVGYLVFKEIGIAFVDYFPIGNNDRILSFFSRERWSIFEKDFAPADKVDLLKNFPSE